MTVSSVLLKKYVLESNAIEGIRCDSGPLFDNHLKAAQDVAKDPGHYTQNVCATHLQLMDNLDYPIDQICGAYRTCRVFVGNREMPDYRQVPHLMEHWYNLCTQVQANGEQACLYLHYIALCIHPFADGNGRVFRLHYNALRLVAGLPWQVFLCSERSEYYKQIRRVEDKDFPAFVKQVSA